jgi:hypothetical protein
MQQGIEYMRGRIHNSVSALDYGASYYVAPTVEGSELEVVRQSVCIDPMSDSTLSSGLGERADLEGEDGGTLPNPIQGCT